MAAVARDEGPYLREWLEYHKLMGVGRFYIYDNGSTDDTREVLEPYIRDATVVYRRIDGYKVQMLAYNDAIRRYGLEAKWMALIDLDEFLVPMVHERVTDFLCDFEQKHFTTSSFNKYPAIAVNWVMFDSNGHEERPAAHGGLVTANYTRVRADHNFAQVVSNDLNVKCIVNPRLVLRWTNPHNGLFVNGSTAVTERLEPVYDTKTRVHSAQQIRINHYHCKSRAEYISKLRRNTQFMGRGAYAAFDEGKLNFCGETQQDTAIFRFLPALRRALGLEEE